MLADRQTHTQIYRQTDTVITILRRPISGEVTSLSYCENAHAMWDHTMLPVTRQRQHFHLSSSSSAIFFCIRRLTCNAAGPQRLSVVPKILYFLIRVQSSPAFNVIYNHILLGLSWDSLEFNLPSSTSSKSFPLDPCKTWPAKAIFCFFTLLYKHNSFFFYSLEYFFVRNLVCPFNFHHSAIAPLLAFTLAKVNDQ